MTKTLTPTRSQMHYAGMLEILNGKDYRKVGNNTTLRIETDGSIHIRLHNTDIVTYRADGSIMLDTDGWQTVTTKARINAWAPVQVCQRKGDWFVNAISDIQGYYDPAHPSGWLRNSDGLPMENDEFYKRSATVPFVDGMDITDLVAEIS